MVIDVNLLFTVSHSWLWIMSHSAFVGNSEISLGSQAEDVVFGACVGDKFVWFGGFGIESLTHLSI